VQEGRTPRGPSTRSSRRSPRRSRSGFRRSSYQALGVLPEGVVARARR